MIIQFRTRILRCGSTASFMWEIWSHLLPQKFSLWWISRSRLLWSKPGQSEARTRPEGRIPPLLAVRRELLLTFFLHTANTSPSSWRPHQSWHKGRVLPGTSRTRGSYWRVTQHVLERFLLHYRGRAAPKLWLPTLPSLSHSYLRCGS